MAAPQCDLTQQVPPANPGAAQGFRMIPTGASLPQVIRILNENFQRLSPFNSFNFFGGNSPGKTGKAGKDAKEGNWTQRNIVQQRVRVYHMDADGTVDKSQFIDYIRTNNLTMSDQKTGATWVYTRKGVDGPNIEILPG